MKKLLIIICLFVLCSSVMASDYIAGDSISLDIYRDTITSLGANIQLNSLGIWGQETIKTGEYLMGCEFTESTTITLITGTASMVHGKSAKTVAHNLDNFIAEFLNKNSGTTLILSKLPPVNIKAINDKITRFNALVKDIAQKYGLKLNDYQIGLESIGPDKIHLIGGAYDGGHFKD